MKKKERWHYSEEIHERQWAEATELLAPFKLQKLKIDGVEVSEAIYQAINGWSFGRFTKSAIETHCNFCNARILPEQICTDASNRDGETCLEKVSCQRCKILSQHLEYQVQTHQETFNRIRENIQIRDALSYEI